MVDDQRAPRKCSPAVMHVRTGDADIMQMSSIGMDIKSKTTTPEASRHSWIYCLCNLDIVPQQRSKSEPRGVHRAAICSFGRPLGCSRPRSPRRL